MRHVLKQLEGKDPELRYHSHDPKLRHHLVDKGIAVQMKSPN